MSIYSSIRRRFEAGLCAFTRLELAACLIGLALLIALALPALAATPSRSHVGQCLNNLRLLGRAVEMWGVDHEGYPPWRTYVSRGGTRPDTGIKPGNAWFEFTALSNELTTPRILACPADAGVKVATEFSTDGARGYMATGFRSQATSYCLTLDPFPGTLTAPPIWPVAGDRNLRFTGIENCALGVSNADRFDVRFFGNGAWTNAVHGVKGNMVQTDGGVSETSSDQFRALFQVSDDNGGLHFLRAR